MLPRQTSTAASIPAETESISPTYSINMGYQPQWQQAPGQGMGMGMGLRRRSRLRGCGCLLLIVVLVLGLYFGATMTSGTTQTIITYVGVGLIVVACLAALVGMLATSRGRAELSRGCAEGCLHAILGGFLGGG